MVDRVLLLSARRTNSRGAYRSDNPKNSVVVEQQAFLRGGEHQGLIPHFSTPNSTQQNQHGDSIHLKRDNADKQLQGIRISVFWRESSISCCADRYITCHILSKQRQMVWPDMSPWHCSLWLRNNDGVNSLYDFFFITMQISTHRYLACSVVTWYVKVRTSRAMTQ